MLGRVLRSLLLNPVLLAISGGAALGALDLAIPGPIERFLAFLGAAAGPTALFALGGTLGRLRLDRRLVLAAGAATAGKLVVYPLLAWLLLGPLLGLELFWVQAGVMLAAMPTATNAFVLAQRFHTGADSLGGGAAVDRDRRPRVSADGLAAHRPHPDAVMARPAVPVASPSLAQPPWLCVGQKVHDPRHCDPGGHDGRDPPPRRLRGAIPGRRQRGRRHALFSPAPRVREPSSARPPWLLPPSRTRSGSGCRMTGSTTSWGERPDGRSAEGAKVWIGPPDPTAPAARTSARRGSTGRSARAAASPRCPSPGCARRPRRNSPPP